MKILVAGAGIMGLSAAECTDWIAGRWISQRPGAMEDAAPPARGGRKVPAQ